MPAHARLQQLRIEKHGTPSGWFIEVCTQSVTRCAVISLGRSNGASLCLDGAAIQRVPQAGEAVGGSAAQCGRGADARLLFVCVRMACMNECM